MGRAIDNFMLPRSRTVLPHPDLPLGEGTAGDAHVILRRASANPSARFAVRLNTILPLPKGKDRGEGERGVGELIYGSA